MSKRAKNSPVGEVSCPYKGCDQVCKVFKFRPRTHGRKTVFSGKAYAECPVHGRVGSDGNPATTEYILTEGTIWGANAAPEKSGEKSAPAHAPARKPIAPTARTVPAKTPDPKPAHRAPVPDPASKRRWWEPLI